MNINKIRGRHHQFSSNTPHQNALYELSDIFNSSGLPTRNPEEPKYIIPDLPVKQIKVVINTFEILFSFVYNDDHQ